MDLFDSLLINRKGFKEALDGYSKEIGEIKLSYGLN
jgi:hypothetical protein